MGAPPNVSGSVLEHGGDQNRFVRPVFAILLALLCWFFLSRWYENPTGIDFAAFLGLGAAAFWVGAGPYLSELRKVSTSRLVLVGAGLLLALPWAEWFHWSHLQDREAWSRQLFLQAAFLYVCLLVFILSSFRVPKKIGSVTLRILDFLSSKTIFFWLPPFLFFLWASYIAVFVFRETPLFQDSAAHLFQAKIFQHFRLYAPVPPLPEFFSTFGDMLVMKDDRWFSMYQPGFALLLAPFMAAGAEWFFCPLLGALTLAIWMSYTRRYHGARTAVLFGWLAVWSPFLFLMSSNVMVFNPELFFLVAAFYLCRLQIEEEKGYRNVLLFMVLAMVMLVRSFSSVAFLLPVLAYTSWDFLKRRSYIFPASIVGGILLGAALLLYFQAQTTGNALVPGYALEYPKLKLGFDGAAEYYHTPAKGLANVSNNLLGLNSWLNGWYSGSLFFVVLFLLLEARFTRWDKLLFLGCAGVALFYFSFFFQDLLLGPRYFFPLSTVFLLMIARAPALESPQGRATVLALLVIAFLSFFPRQLSGFVHKYNLNATFPGYLKKEIEGVRGEKTLVFLDKTVREYFTNWNDPFLQSNVVICIDLGARDTEIRNLFPGYRPLYFRSAVDQMRLSRVDPGYRFYSEPDRSPPGSLSFFQLVLDIEASRAVPELDMFTTCYGDLQITRNASEKLAFIETRTNQSTVGPLYRKNFEKALYHTARVVLLPLAAIQQKGAAWHAGFDFNEFRTEIESALSLSQQSGEVGMLCARELEKVKKRIDHDTDGVLTDVEIQSYLQLQLSTFHVLN